MAPSPTDWGALRITDRGGTKAPPYKAKTELEDTNSLVILRNIFYHKTFSFPSCIFLFDVI